MVASAPGFPELSPDGDVFIGSASASNQPSDVSKKSKRQLQIVHLQQLKNQPHQH